MEMVINGELCKIFKFDHTKKKMVYAQPRIHPGKWEAQDPLGFKDKQIVWSQLDNQT